MGRLDGKVALVTGGARGQGAAEGRLFAAEGAAVVITDVLDGEGEGTAASFGGRYLHHDVTSEERWAAVIEEVLRLHGRLDALVNNAGVFSPAGLTEVSLAEYRRVIEVNQIGVFLGMQAAAGPMMAARAGSIINISSVAGLRGGPASFAYTASKWAVRGMTRSAARHLARYGIRVNSIHPGLIETPMLQEVAGAAGDHFAGMVRGIPLRRVAGPDDVARMALFLASDDSSYSTGSEFIVDGGVTA